jgi:hypothetical protein
MCPKLIRVGMLILTISSSANAAPLVGVPSPADASAQTSGSPESNIPARSNASSESSARPTPAQLDQPGAIAIATPNQRNRGTTVATPDRPLFGRLNLQAQGRQFEQPPTLQLAPDEAAKSSGASNADAAGQAHN